MVPQYILDDPRYRGDVRTAGTTRRRIREQVVARDGRVCQYCGTVSAPGYQVDHIIPRSRGGSKKGLHNQVVACTECNQRKGEAVWIPHNLATITSSHPDQRTQVLELAVPRG